MYFPTPAPDLMDHNAPCDVFFPSMGLMDIGRRRRGGAEEPRGSDNIREEGAGLVV